MHNLLEARLIGVLVGLAVAILGLALATNFRDVTERRARRSVESLKWVGPPWSRLTDSELEQRVARQVVMSRVIGAVFAAAGVLFVVLSVFAHLASRS